MRKRVEEALGPATGPAISVLVLIQQALLPASYLHEDEVILTPTRHSWTHTVYDA